MTENRTLRLFVLILNGEGATAYHLYDSRQEQEALQDLWDQPPVLASSLQLPVQCSLS